MILLIDNYDSFTYNLVQALGSLGAAVETVRNDALTVEEIEARAPERIVISPGPCTPRESGVSNRVIRRLAGRIPILGVCLGHQCIAHSFGARIVRAKRPMHGKTSDIRHDGARLYEGLPNPFPAMRYHSLIVEESTLPEDFRVTARADDGEIMGLRHKTWPLEGVQFHPESYRTKAGVDLLGNFLRVG
ncbi:MAG TPA: aminodeoxychorismate/anthranilate synthase component II [Planctomycetota bacterium]|jgi:anthranilate synthase component 2/para-aminobenzoate synthetase component 2|nr:aminodeoxychorismate/anthranilate synthase component II [Planctomycetota bacterium]